MIMIKKLDSGITFICQENPNIHSVNYAIHVKAGSANEKKGEEGISHFLEHMNFKGTTNYTARELSIKIDELGSFFNAYTSKDMTVYLAKVLNEHTDKASDLLIELFMNSVYDEREIEKERNVVLEEMNMITDNPDDFLFETMNEKLFVNTIYENSVLGDPDVIKSITPEQLKAYKEREYVKDDIVISIYGNCDMNAQIEKFNKGLSALKQSKNKIYYKNYDNPPMYKNFVKDVEQAHFFMGKKLDKCDEKTFCMRKLITTILGGTMASRLFQKIREEKGLAYAIYSMHYDFAFSDISSITAGIPNNKLKEALDAIKCEMKELKRTGISKDEFYRAKETIESTLIFQNEYQYNSFKILTSDYLQNGKIRSVEEKIKILNSISLEDMKEEAESMYDIDDYSIFVLSKKDIDIEGIMK